MGEKGVVTVEGKGRGTNMGEQKNSISVKNVQTVLIKKSAANAREIA